MEEHLDHLEKVLKRFAEFHLTVNMDKCDFAVASTTFLGHQMSAEGIQPIPDNVNAIADYKLPESITQLRLFVGLVNFYRKFIPYCSSLLAPLTDVFNNNGTRTEHLTLTPAASVPIGEGRAAKSHLSVITGRSRSSPTLNRRFGFCSRSSSRAGQGRNYNASSFFPKNSARRSQGTVPLTESCWRCIWLSGISSISWRVDSSPFTQITSWSQIIYVNKTCNYISCVLSNP